MKNSINIRWYIAFLGSAMLLGGCHGVGDETGSGSEVSNDDALTPGGKADSGGDTEPDGGENSGTFKTMEVFLVNDQNPNEMRNFTNAAYDGQTLVLGSYEKATALDNDFEFYLYIFKKQGDIQDSTFNLQQRLAVPHLATSYGAFNSLLLFDTNNNGRNDIVATHGSTLLLFAEQPDGLYEGFEDLGPASKIVAADLGGGPGVLMVDEDVDGYFHYHFLSSNDFTPSGSNRVASYFFIDYGFVPNPSVVWDSLCVADITGNGMNDILVGGMGLLLKNTSTDEGYSFEVYGPIVDSTIGGTISVLTVSPLRIVTTDTTHFIDMPGTYRFYEGEDYTSLRLIQEASPLDPHPQGLFTLKLSERAPVTMTTNSDGSGFALFDHFDANGELRQEPLSEITSVGPPYVDDNGRALHSRILKEDDRSIYTITLGIRPWITEFRK